MGSSKRIKFFPAVLVALNSFLVAGCDNPAAMNESSANVKHISPGEFAGEVAWAAGPVVVDFYATWCVPCRVLAPMLDQAAEPLAGKIKFFKVNIDEAPRLAVDFYATWCGPCRQLSPMLDKLAGGYTGKIKFVKVNVDESPGLAQNFQVQAIPTVLLFKDGKLADRIVGVPTTADLKSKLDTLLTGK